MFLATLDVSLLAYANDIRGDKSLRFWDNFVTSCWVISLLMSLTIVFVSGICSMFHLWQTFLDLGEELSFEFNPCGVMGEPKRPPENASANDPPESASANDIKDLDKFQDIKYLRRFRIYRRADVQVLLTFLSALFNAFVIPALLACILGIAIFAWRDLPLLTGVSSIAFMGFVCFLLLVTLTQVVWRTLPKRRANRLEKVQEEEIKDALRE